MICNRQSIDTLLPAAAAAAATTLLYVYLCCTQAGKRLDIVRSDVCLSLLVGDVHCIIEAMIGRGGAVALQQPQLVGVPDTVMADPDR